MVGSVELTHQSVTLPEVRIYLAVGRAQLNGFEIVPASFNRLAQAEIEVTTVVVVFGIVRVFLDRSREIRDRFRLLSDDRVNLRKVVEKGRAVQSVPISSEMFLEALLAELA